ncbi:MAG TPA: efflux RND transporter periplasmic adaptor subunit [Opitutaceae bacterium]|nr:efflux RND transporter periplasmic adaptor subunit [Opitutaceae bacterium]
MNTKHFLIIIAVAVLAAAGGYFLAPKGHDHTPAGAAAGASVYQCPMHPWIKSTNAGDKCTICGMALVVAAAASNDGPVDPNLVTLMPASAAVTGIKTTDVSLGPLVRTLRVTGVIDDDETRHRFVSAYAAGRIEKLFVNYVGSDVAMGDPLAVLYSPDLLIARQEFHSLARSGMGSPALLAASREKLRQLGLLDVQIDALAAAETVTRDTEMLSPLSGTVVARNAEAAYEGGYVDAGTRLFEIGDFTTMWFVFDAYESDIAWIRPGQHVDIAVPSLPGRVITAPVAFIDPNLNEMTRTARVRVELPNPNRELFHRQTASATVRLESPETLLVPRTAVLQHSGKPVVYVGQGANAYAAREIRLGRVGDTHAEVVSGLEAGDRVVTEGGLILDGQAQLAHAAVGATHDHGTPAPKPKATSDDKIYALIRTLALAAADASAPLAADDLAGYQRALPALRAALDAWFAGDPESAGSILAPFKGTLVDGPSITEARRAFEPLSTALADVARVNHLHHREKLWIFQCPMTPVLGTGRWLQRNDELRNPFFGSAMLTCGEPVN